MADFSFWVASNMPLDDLQRIGLLKIDSPVQRLRKELELLQKVLSYNTFASLSFHTTLWARLLKLSHISHRIMLLTKCLCTKWMGSRHEKSRGGDKGPLHTQVCVWFNTKMWSAVPVCLNKTSSHGIWGWACTVDPLIWYRKFLELVLKHT